MKKTVLIIICCILLLSCIPAAMADNYKCSDHPNAGVYETYYSAGYGEQYSVTQHRIHGYHCYYCNRCNKEVWDESYFDLHSFVGNRCAVCGFTRPAKTTLRNEAEALIYKDNIYNHACWVLYESSIFASPNSSSAKIGNLEFGEGYYVNAYQQSGNQIWLQLKKLPSAKCEGWVLAENISIQQKELEGPNGYETGRTIRITTSSGRGRSDAGTEYPYLETVHYGEKYTVLDAKTGTNGNTWYKIRVDGREVWISAGLATFD